MMLGYIPTREKDCGYIDRGICPMIDGKPGFIDGGWEGIDGA